MTGMRDRPRALTSRALMPARHDSPLVDRLIWLPNYQLLSTRPYIGSIIDAQGFSPNRISPSGAGAGP